MAAAASCWIASVLLGHERPFFAPVAAVVALGVSYAARLRQVGEVVAGVALGVAVGGVFVRLAGTGTWQIALVIVRPETGQALPPRAGELLAEQAISQLGLGDRRLAPQRQGFVRAGRLQAPVDLGVDPADEERGDAVHARRVAARAVNDSSPDR